MKTYTVYECGYCREKFFNEDLCNEHEKTCGEKQLKKLQEKMGYTPHENDCCMNCKYCDVMRISNKAIRFRCDKNCETGNMFLVSPNDYCGCFKEKNRINDTGCYEVDVVA